MNHVIFAADEQYSIPLSVAIYSFCKQNPSSAEVHVLYSALSKKTLINLSGITKKFSNKLTLHCIDNNEALICSKLNILLRQHITGI